MTFMVDQDGVVLQKDLEPDTAKIAQEMIRFAPDNTWKMAQPEQTQPQEAQPVANTGPVTAQH
jgi:hypothetical protein